MNNTMTTTMPAQYVTADDRHRNWRRKLKQLHPLLQTVHRRREGDRLTLAPVVLRRIVRHRPQCPWCGAEVGRCGD